MDDAPVTPPEPQRDATIPIAPPTPDAAAASEESTPTASIQQPPMREPPAWVGAPHADESPPQKEKHGSFLKELPILIIIAFGLALLIKTFLLQAFFIPSASMTPTLQIGDRVLVNKLVYRIHPPRRGDIIVFIEEPGPHKNFWGRVRSFLTEGLGVTRPKSRDFIKRVIGLPGETIQITNGVVNIKTPQGRSFNLSEPYLNSERDTGSYGPFTIPAGTYFVMGDNRTNSSDSRTALGPIPKSRIIGRAFIRIWPLGRFGFFHRPTYPSTAAGGVAALAPVFVLASGAVARRHRAA